MLFLLLRFGADRRPVGQYFSGAAMGRHRRADGERLSGNLPDAAAVWRNRSRSVRSADAGFPVDTVDSYVHHPRTA